MLGAAARRKVWRNVGVRDSRSIGSAWTEAIGDCSRRTGLTAFSGDCETHHISITISRGAWVPAEQLAREACASTQCFDPTHAGVAFAGIGEIRLRLGDLATVARLELQRSRPAEAAALINVGLARQGWDRLDRSRLLADQMTIALAVGDLATARAATTELAESAGIRADSDVAGHRAGLSWPA